MIGKREKMRGARLSIPSHDAVETRASDPSNLYFETVGRSYDTHTFENESVLKMINLAPLAHVGIQVRRLRRQMRNKFRRLAQLR